MAYLRLRLDGQGLEARDALRNRLRPCAGPVQRCARQTLEMLLDRSENAPGEPGDNDRHPHVGVTDCVEYVGQAGIKWLELLNMCQGTCIQTNPVSSAGELRGRPVPLPSRASSDSRTMTIQGDTEMWMMGEVPRLLLRDLGRAATCYMVCCGYLWGWDYGNSGGREPPW